jgi:plasmid replication initiation protein
MTDTNRPNRPALLPDRHALQDFFICDVTDAIPKDDIGSMEHPVFSLATKPDTKTREYAHKGVKITITPSVLGLATIHDKDILIYCISQLMAKMNSGKSLSRTLHIKARDLLIATNRNIDGRAYEQLIAALDRLSGTRIKTNIITGGEEITSGFGLIDFWNIIRHTKSGRMSVIQIDLSRWVFNAVLGKEVLTLHKNYFRLRKPLERRMYELARKHCGKQNEWIISLELLREKCGAITALKKFRDFVVAIIKENEKCDHFPDYCIAINSTNVCFTNRNSIKAAREEEKHLFPQLDAETFHDARTVAPGLDVYVLQQEWLNFWVDSGKPELKNPDAAFIGFCKSRYNRRKPA